MAEAPPQGVEARGQYSDGRTAASRAVHVVVAEPGLIIRDPEGNIVAAWPADEVRLLDRPDRDGRVRLCRAGEMARLAVADPTFIAALRSRFARLRSGPYGHRAGWRAAVLGSVAALAALAVVFVVLLPSFAHYVADRVPPRLEAQMGRRVADALIAALGEQRKSDGDIVCRDPAGLAALRKLVGRLAAAAHLRTGVEVRVIGLTMVNAVALPGGQILVFKGLLDFAKGPNELAGVLAHEIAHLELRHPTEMAIERGTASFLVGLLLGDAFGLTLASGIGQAMVSTAYTREAERAADARGLALLEAAALDPSPVGEFFARLARGEGGAVDVLAFLRSHPATSDRARLFGQARTGGAAALDESEWQALKKICG